MERQIPVLKVRGFESHPGHEGKEVSLIEKFKGAFFSLAPIINGYLLN